MADINVTIQKWKEKVMIPKGENCKAVNIKVPKACAQVISGKVQYEYRTVVRLDCQDHYHDKPMQNRFTA